MKFIFGSVVGRKFQKVSHKIAKVRCTKKEEHIVLENMHEPIIDIDTWNKAQEKLNVYTKSRERKYDHPLKGLVYCGKCGNKATLRCIKSQELKNTLKNIEKTIEEIYQDKINKVIQLEDFKIIYEKKQNERNKILKEIKKLEKELKESKEKLPKIDFKEIKQIANEFLKMEKPNKIILEKLIKRIEFDKEKNIKIKLTFQNHINVNNK